LADQVFLVTGATGGIGAATARGAAEAGYRLVLAGRSPDRLLALADSLGGLAVRCDVTEADQLRALADRIAAEFGRLDVVFANAGQFSAPPLLAADAPAEWRDMVLTNVYGTALTAHVLWPMLVASSGHLVLTGSVAGRVTVPGSLYSPTKWAVTALGQSLRAAAVGTGVRVTVIQPGLVDAGHIAPERQADPKLAPADVARAVLYAVTQPPTVDVNEIVLRPKGQVR
jgi:NADP-dependent 3-hydroxy acid dehydrogenase YdfG